MINLRPFEDILERELTTIIERKGLVDSGALKNSIQVSITLSPFSIDITSEDYLVYLEGDYGVVEEFSTSSVVTQVIEEVIKEFVESIKNEE